MNEEQTTSQQPRILIVEDDPKNVELMEAQLHGEGYSVDSARDGEEALRRLSQAAPDLVLLDIMLPKKNGFEVCKKIKSDAAMKGVHCSLGISNSEPKAAYFCTDQ